MLRILGHPTSINVRKVLWACEEIGVPYERENWGANHRSTSEPGFLALNPNALVPVIVDDGMVLSESNTIVRYLAAKHQRHDLLPVDASERASVEMWMDWQATEFNNSWRYAFYGLVRKNPSYQDPEKIAASVKSWTEHVVILNAQLEKTNTFVCGEAFTVADIVLGLSLNRWLSTPLERPTLPVISSYFDRLRKRHAFVKLKLGDVA